MPDATSPPIASSTTTTRAAVPRNPRRQCAEGDGRPRVPPRLQFAYDWKEDRALLEATATNMEADVYGSIHDNFQYFAESPLDQDQHRDRPGRHVRPATGTSTAPGSSSASWRNTSAPRPTRRRRADASINRQIWKQAKADCRERTTAGSTRLRRSAAIASHRPDHEHPGGLLPRLRQLRLGQREARGLVQGRRPVSVRWIRQTLGSSAQETRCAELADVPLRQRLLCSSNRTRPRRPSTSRSTSRRAAGAARTAPSWS